MRLVWENAAKADKKEIRNYIKQRNADAADKLEVLFKEKASQLLACPHMGRLGRLPGTREWVAHPHYILVYNLTPETVHILRVLHTARRWPSGRRR